MSESDRTTRRLSTGEVITFTERDYMPAGRRWEAEALVFSLPGPADRHAIGSTPEEAAAGLERYIAELRDYRD